MRRRRFGRWVWIRRAAGCIPPIDWHGKAHQDARHLLIKVTRTRAQLKVRITFNTRSILILIGTIMSISGIASIVQSVVELGQLLQYTISIYREWTEPIKELFFEIFGFHINRFVLDYYIVGAPFWARFLPHIIQVTYDHVWTEGVKRIKYWKGITLPSWKRSILIAICYGLMHIVFIITLITRFVFWTTIWPYLIFDNVRHTARTSMKATWKELRDNKGMRGEEFHSHMRWAKKGARAGFAASENFKCVMVCFVIIAAVSYGIDKLPQERNAQIVTEQIP